jgi:hypothetical protein
MVAPPIAPTQAQTRLRACRAAAAGSCSRSRAIRRATMRGNHQPDATSMPTVKPRVSAITGTQPGRIASQTMPSVKPTTNRLVTTA